jgi:SAM-dependent methyltransferase
MDTPCADNPQSIKFYVKRFILSEPALFRGKTVVDVPAGNGVTSRILHEAGARVIPMDLFPQYFRVRELACLPADLSQRLPLDDRAADHVLCQEGIEHLSDPLHAFREFNRILKPAGRLFITTPNFSNLRCRLSYLLTESERAGSVMPPNEVNAVWFSDQQDQKVYLGHIYLTGLQKLRVAGVLNGFTLRQVHFTRCRRSNLLLFPFLYPFIWAFSTLTYLKHRRKHHADVQRSKVLKEVYKWAIHPGVLLDASLFVEWEKTREAVDVPAYLRSFSGEYCS